MSQQESADHRFARRAVDAIDLAANLVSRLAVALLMGLILVQVIARYILQSPVGGIVDISRQYLMPIVVLLSISYLESTDGHIRILALYERTSDVYKTIVNLVGNLATGIFFGLLLYASARHSLDALSRGVRTSGDINYPLYTALAIAPAMSLLMVLRMLVQTYEGLLRLLQHRRDATAAITQPDHSVEPI